jgi:LysR family transcriptional regulator, cys regulon transcriptional activator
MNLHQFRFVQEAVRRNLNLTETAKALHTSQPGVSKAIIELEEELGIEIFVRHGKRLRRVTEPGQQVLQSVEVIMREVANLKRIGDEFSKQDSRHAVDRHHAHAGALLPARAGGRLRKRFPKVQVSAAPGRARPGGAMLLDDVADIGMATEALARTKGLITLPCYEWQHVLVVPAGHPLAAVERPRWSTWRRAAGALPPHGHRPHAHRPGLRARAAEAGGRAGGHRLRRHQDLRAPGPGRGHRGRDRDARRRNRRRPGGAPLGHLFGSNVARVAFKRGAYLRQFVCAFAEMLSDRLSPAPDPARDGRRTAAGTDYEL